MILKRLLEDGDLGGLREEAVGFGRGMEIFRDGGFGRIDDL